MRADRLLSLLLLLQSRGRMSAPALAQRLEVSERTIFRDLDALSAAGVPVYAERGKHGGCVLRPGYRTDLTGLNQAEVASLFAGVAGRVLDDLGLGAGLRRALVKLEAALPSAQRVDAERVRQRLHVDAAAWFGADERVPHLAALRVAVFADRVVELTHERGDGRAVTRRVEPLGLVVKGGIWYLVALTAGEPRVYRVSRVTKVRATTQSFERPRRFDLAGFWARWSRDFVASIPEYHVRMRVAARALATLPQVFGDRVRPAIEAARKVRNGDRIIELTFDSLEAACGRLLGLGVDIEVIEPAELRTALHTTAAEVVQLYHSSGDDSSQSRAHKRSRAAGAK